MLKYQLKRSQGFSIIEAIAGLAAIGIIIAGTLAAVRYIHDLQYVLDIKAVDNHFDKIRKMLYYENCDSFIGDSISSRGKYMNSVDNLLQRKDNSIPEIKVQKRCTSPPCGFNVLYAVEDKTSGPNVTGPNGEKIPTQLSDSHIKLSSMSLEKDSNITASRGGGYYILKMLFYSRKAEKSSTQSLRTDQDISNLTKQDRGKFERSLRVYLSWNIATRKITNCSVHPSFCKREQRKIELTHCNHSAVQRNPPQDLISQQDLTVQTQGSKVWLDMTLRRRQSGEYQQFRYSDKDKCICLISFYCHGGSWNQHGECVPRTPGGTRSTP